MKDHKPVHIRQFDIVASSSADQALVCFAGRMVVPDNSRAWLEDGMLMIERVGHADLCFGQHLRLLPTDQALLRSAEEVYINQVFENVDHVSRIHLQHRD